MSEQDPQTEAGRAAAADKAAAAARLTAEADQAQAAEAERRRAQTAKARETRAANARPRPDAFAQATAEADMAAPEPLAAEPGGCAECREGQAEILARLGALETRVQAIAKIVVTGLVAGAVIYVLRGRETAQAEAIEG